MAKSVLGIAFGPGLIQVAELLYDAKTAKLVRAGDFVLGDGDALEKPEDLGKKFGAFLKERKFSARQAIAGLATQWLMLKDKTVPTMSAENLAGMLRLQAERDFSLEPSDLVLDYVVGESLDGGSRPLLLTAALRVRVEQISTLLKTAGVSARVLTSSALALAAGCFAGTVLSAGPFGAEFVVSSRGNLLTPCMLASSASADGAWISSAGLEARRALAMRAADPVAPVGFWNGAGVAPKFVDELSRGMDAVVRPLGQFAGVDASGVPDAARFGHAAALARLAKSPDLAALNFLDSKLAERTEGFFSKARIWMTAAAVLAVLALGWLIYSWNRDSAEFAALKDKSAARKAESKSIKEFVDRYATTQGWYDKRPNVLDCLKELAVIIPSNGDAWLTKLSVKEDFHCELSAKAINNDRYFDMLQQIEKNQSFKEVKFMGVNVQDKKKTEVTFVISFIYWKQ